MNFKQYIIPILSILMLIALLDAIPDPPAVSPHATDLISCRHSILASSPADRQINNTWTCRSSFQVRWTTFISSNEAALPAAPAGLSTYAADPSPPLNT